MNFISYYFGTSNGDRVLNEKVRIENYVMVLFEIHFDVLCLRMRRSSYHGILGYYRNL